ncbi:MAG TPA: DUF488 domain-containing protein [Alphaproteobacteria bacterium]|nr:DUF488 domain-containing protein [Alphaproteobacteria bacterium]
MTIFTIGHSTRPLAVFIDLLRAAGIDLLIDVRRFPHSRRQPQFNIEMLPGELAKAGIDYLHMPELGGRRPKRADQPSPHSLWRETGFRNYADYAETPAFRAAFVRLLSFTRDGKRPAIMCAEALWWQCHRRIIADYLLAAGIEVMHILDKKTEPAHLTEGARPRPDGTILYSATPLLD